MSTGLRLVTVVVVVAVAGMALLLTAGGALFRFTGANDENEAAGARLEPATGAYFGVNLDWSNDSASGYNERLGYDAAVFVQFSRFPLTATELSYLAPYYEQVANAEGIALLTLEPAIDLEAVTATVAGEFVLYLKAIQDEYEIPIMIRFAHEMNGSWYSWGQQPEAYISAFRTMASAIHEEAPEIAMIWAPNYGSGYPYFGGQYQAQPGTESFSLLDTNGDGELSMSDDPYLPYYPGDEYVDWVGVSLYHWGNRWPWGENELPEAHKFSAQLTGQYTGENGDERGLPDFYATFGEEHGKPIAIVETAALYNPDQDGPTELEIKQAWWTQVFAPETREQFPHIKMINWFEWDKFEVEIGGQIDWTLSQHADILAAFLEDFDAKPYRFAPIR